MIHNSLPWILLIGKSAAWLSYLTFVKFVSTFSKISNQDLISCNKSASNQSHDLKSIRQFNSDIDARCPFCETNIFKIHSTQSLNYITSNYRLKKMQSVWIKEVIYCSHIFIAVHVTLGVHVNDKNRLWPIRKRIMEHAMFSGLMHTEKYRL